MSGNCAIGRLAIPSPPRSRMRIDRTIATAGRRRSSGNIRVHDRPLACLEPRPHDRPDGDRDGLDQRGKGRSEPTDGEHLVGGHPHALLERRSEEHTSELQSRSDLVCRLLLEKKKNRIFMILFKKKKKMTKSH